MKYINKRNGKVATKDEASYNDKTKTVIMVYEDGSNTTVSESTLKRWWKKLDSPEVVESLIDLDNPITEEEAEAAGMLSGDEAVEVAVVDPDDVAGDGTPLAEVGKQIFEQAKAKAEKAKKERVKKEKAEKKERKPKAPKVAVTDLVEKIRPVVESNGFRFKAYEKSPRFLPLYDDVDNGKAVCTIYLAQQKVALKLKEADVPAGQTPDRVRNRRFAAVFEMSYDNLDRLNTILAALKKEEK